MCIHNHKYKEPKSLPHLKPLFDAMIAGQTIRKVICMNGTSEDESPNHDIVFENFTALRYDDSFSPLNGNNLDEVIVNKYAVRIIDGVKTMRKNFYMVWVRSFELGDYIELADGTHVAMEDPFLSKIK